MPPRQTSRRDSLLADLFESFRAKRASHCHKNRRELHGRDYSQCRGNQGHLSIICFMDTGTGAALVYRDAKREFIIPMPVIGHWLKKVWGEYVRWVKTSKIPRIPGL